MGHEQNDARGQMTHVTALRRTTREGLRAAVHRSRALSKRGMLERLFTISFRGLVYSQIWEDPLIDIEALAHRAGRPHRGDRVGRLQCLELSHRRSGTHHRRRPQWCACCAQPAETLRGAAFSGPRHLLPLLRIGGSARKYRCLSALPAAAPRSRVTQILGIARPLRPSPARHVHPQYFPLRPARQFHRRRPSARQALWLRPRTLARSAVARGAASAVRACRCAGVRSALRALARQTAGLALWARHSTLAI